MEVAFRPATVADLELLLAWRSNPDVYEYFYEQDEPLEWDEHVDWWESRENRRDWIVTVRERTRWRDVGSVCVYDLDADVPEVGVYVGEVTAWGGGIASEAVEFAADWLRARNYQEVRARIVEGNDASKRLFERVGFECVGESRPGESAYRLSL